MKPIESICRLRKTTLRVILTIAVTGSLFTGSALAGQLIYTPVNPAFGGSPLNGSYLLQKAQAGKKYQMPTFDLDFMDSLGIIAQTETSLIFKKGDSYYSYDINTGTLRYIDFNKALGMGIESSSGSLE